MVVLHSSNVPNTDPKAVLAARVLRIEASNVGAYNTGSALKAGGIVALQYASNFARGLWHGGVAK